MSVISRTRTAVAASTPGTRAPRGRPTRSSAGTTRAACTGVVEAWGRVQLHREGFRARYARPTVLILPRAAVGTGHEATIRRLAAAHRAEVAVVGRAGDLERYCRERDLGLSPAAVGDLLGEEPDPPAEESSGVSTPAKLSSSLAEMVLTGFFGLLALLWYGFLAVAAVSVLLAIVNGSSEGDGERARVPPPAGHLEIVDTRIGQKAGGILYATRVRNADRALGCARRRSRRAPRDGRRANPGATRRRTYRPAAGDDRARAYRADPRLGGDDAGTRGAVAGRRGLPRPSRRQVASASRRRN